MAGSAFATQTLARLDQLEQHVDALEAKPEAEPVIVQAPLALPPQSVPSTDLAAAITQGQQKQTLLALGLGAALLLFGRRR